MATLYLSWDNSAISGNPNVISQRVSWRRKSIGGAYFTTGMSPSNDMSPATNGASHTTVVVNQVFEYKVEAICTEGGPISNLNGNQEGIIFQCNIMPEFTPGANNILVELDVSATDIIKARIKLYKAFDDSLQDNLVVTASAGTISHDFTGLAVGTPYYVTIDYIALVNGVEVSVTDQDGSPCGNNEDGDYAATTTGIPLCTTYQIQPSGSVTVEYERCDTGSPEGFTSSGTEVRCMRTGSLNITGGAAEIIEVGPCE